MTERTINERQLYSRDSDRISPVPEEEHQHSFDIQRIELILAQKRTHLSIMRTGIGVCTLPLSVVTVLIATSRYYDLRENFLLATALTTICIGLLVLGIYLIGKSIYRIRKQDELIAKIMKEDPFLNDLLD